MHKTLSPILMLVLANLFMTFAWYGHLKNMQAIITMVVFAGFAIVYMKAPITRNFVYASICLLGAAFFIFRE